MKKKQNEEVSSRSSPDKKKAHSPANAAAKGKIEVAPHGAGPGPRPTKTELLISLLNEPCGATLGQIMEATSWQSHSIRGFISGTLVKKRKLRVKSFQRDGERVYAIREKPVSRRKPRASR